MNYRSLTHNDLPAAIGELFIRLDQISQCLSRVASTEPVDDIMDMQQAADFLKIKKSTLYARINNIPHSKVGSKNVFSRKKLQQWVEGRQELTADEVNATKMAIAKSKKALR